MGSEKVGSVQTALGHPDLRTEPGKLEDVLIAEYNQVFLELRRIRASRYAARESVRLSKLPAMHHGDAGP